MQIFKTGDYSDTSGEGFTKRMLRQSPAGLVFCLNFEPGQTLPAHTHAESDIAVCVLKGEGEVTADGHTERVSAGSVVHCKGNESFSAHNSGSSRLSLLVVLYPGNDRFAGNIR